MEPADLIGFAGVALLLLAYVLNLRSILHRESCSYTGLNTIGAALATYASWLISYMPFVILEGTWCVTSMIALLRIVSSRNRVDAETPL